MASTLESIFLKRNNLSSTSKGDTSFPATTSSVGKKKKKQKHAKSGKMRNTIIDPNSPNYSYQLLKEQLRSKFKGYDYGLSDW